MAGFSIGGKTGVNIAGYKNMIGTIRQPEFTYICPQVLESLPMEDFQAGAAEMLKTFIIEDNGNYEKAISLLKTLTEDFIKLCDGATLSDGEARWPEALAERLADLTPLIAAAAKVKAGVVSRDQFENGERRKLNLGHTLGHGIEANSNFTVSHGKAVAIGMVLASRIAAQLGLCDQELPAKIQALIYQFELPTETAVAPEELLQAALSDKKRTGGTINLVLPLTIGNCILRSTPVEELPVLIAQGVSP